MKGKKIILKNFEKNIIICEMKIYFFSSVSNMLYNDKNITRVKDIFFCNLYFFVYHNLNMYLYIKK